ncbi:TBC1 domain family member 2B [Halotydeus destructor]|nr:TBC1 domain family member 2B [Halotydeus destructor]
MASTGGKSELVNKMENAIVKPVDCVNRDRGNENSISDAKGESEVDQLRSQLQRFAIEKASLKEQLSLHQDIIQAKDQHLIKLTNRLFEMENNGPKIQASSRFYAQGDDLRELEALRDAVRAYKDQNEYMNNQIIELNHVKVASEKKHQEQQLKILDWEAKCCQIQSKLLSLLKELKQLYETPQDGESKEEVAAKEDSIKALVTRLLSESSIDIPLSWQSGNRSRTSTCINKQQSTSEYDDLGFNMKVSCYDDSFETEDQIRRQEASLGRLEDRKTGLITWKLKWDAYVASLDGHKLLPSEKLKSLLRSGVPQEYRSKIWRMMIYGRVDNLRQQKGADYYERLLANETSPQRVTATTRSQFYDPTAKQIELDLLRTLPNNRHFESLESDGTCRLRKVLTAFSRHNPSVGYCQGLNRLAAVALLFMPEEESFWCLVAVVEKIMPPFYYSQSLLGAHVDQYVFRDLLAEKLPRVHYHLEQFGIEISLFSWFLTCFVDNIPVTVYLRIWDVFLLEGNKVLFRFALAFLKLYEEHILSLQDSMQINTFLRTLGERKCDVNYLCNIAFSRLNPLPMSKIQAKRAHHSILVKEELRKLDDLRKALPSHDTADSGHSD